MASPHSHNLSSGSTRNPGAVRWQYYLMYLQIIFVLFCHSFDLKVASKVITLNSFPLLLYYSTDPHSLRTCIWHILAFADIQVYYELHTAKSSERKRMLLFTPGSHFVWAQPNETDLWGLGWVWGVVCSHTNTQQINGETVLGQPCSAWQAAHPTLTVGS